MGDIVSELLISWFSGVAIFICGIVSMIGTFYTDPIREWQECNAGWLVLVYGGEVADIKKDPLEDVEE